MKELEASKQLIEHLQLYTDQLKYPYHRILACLFEMYESQLDQTIEKVKQGSIKQNQIMPSLAQFKKALSCDCELLIDDIWNNYKFYACQQPIEHQSPERQELAQTTGAPSSFKKSEIVVPYF